MSLNTIEEAISDIKLGKMVIVVEALAAFRDKTR